MTPIELATKIESIYGFLASDEKETLTELIQQAKEDWENDAYHRGYHESKYEPE